jgi:uncharacterized protein (DUF2141 family)
MSPPGCSLREARRRAVVPFAAATLVLALTAGAARAAKVEIHVLDVSDARGHVRAELCTRDTFLTGNCPYGGAAPATPGETVVAIDAPPGRYAIQAFHDDLDEGRVHQNFLGIPREQIGFSNDAPLRLRGPSFKDAAIAVGDGVREVTLRLRKIGFGGGR